MLVSMQKPTIAFIGAGNMATAIIDGLLKAGYPATNIYASCPSAERLATLQKSRGIQTSTDNCTAAAQADILVLAVKPKIIATVLAELGAEIQKKRPLIISVAASVPEAYIRRVLGSDPEIAIIRAMPNTPAAFGQGATVLCSQTTNAQQKKLVENLFAAVGTTYWLEDEQHMNAVTALSGSGPAYFFLLMEALATAATQMGLPHELAQTLTIQTALGAAQTVLHSQQAPATLRQQVMSPGGGTEAALKTLAANEFNTIIATAFTAAQARYDELLKNLP